MSIKSFDEAYRTDPAFKNYMDAYKLGTVQTGMQCPSCGKATLLVKNGVVECEDGKCGYFDYVSYRF